MAADGDIDLAGGVGFCPASDLADQDLSYCR